MRPTPDAKAARPARAGDRLQDGLLEVAQHYRHCHKAPPLELDQEVKQIHHRPKVGYTDNRVDVDLG